MGLIDKMLARFQDDWCKGCKREMEKARKQLFVLPGMTVGNYVRHEDAGYYKKHLRMVDKKADIPPGMYACGAIQYRCPECGKRLTKLELFLPVRDEEKHEIPVLFEHGELDDFLWL
ncbi:MAG: hypothetical protein HDT37_06355 [Clostridiales bacterium]|nr:hypothetical protein [Clostridiales bacterium]